MKKNLAVSTFVSATIVLATFVFPVAPAFAYDLTNSGTLPKIGGSECKTEGEYETEWHFVVSGGGVIPTPLPIYATATFQNIGDILVPFDKVNNPGTEAQYTLPGYLYDTLLGASITFADSYSGNFILSHWPCVPPVAKLTVTKVVVNDNGGTKIVADFPLFVDATSVTSGIQNTFDPGEYTVSETGDSGYAGTITGDCAADGSITLAAGDEKSCTITNDDIDPVVHVIKHVINDNGGTAVASNFTITVSGTNVSNPEFPGDESGTTVNFDVGSYNVVEEGVSGYTGSYSEGCSGTLGLGESATCIITNDDDAPSLTLVKQVTNDNGGTALPGDWTLTATGYDSESPQVGAYDLSESGGPVGYTQTSLTCDNAQGQVTSVTLGLGDDVTCTFINDDIQPHLIVIKHVINDDGDTALASDFTMHLTGNTPSTNDFAGSEAGVNVALNAGAYTADETNSAGYVKTLSADCTGTIAVGETKTCTITNNDIPHATRTLGFWQTHTIYTISMFNAGPFGAGPWTIGTHMINSPSILFSAFYASISKKSSGVKRLAIDQARMQMLQQWVATKLNCQAFGCSASTHTLLTDAAIAWTSGTATQILSYASQLNVYNNSNDALPIFGQGKSTPSASQTQAASALSFWDSLP